MTEPQATKRTTPAADDVAVVDAWAKEYGLRAVFDGECGFGRPCVGIQATSGNWLDYDPLRHPNYDRIYPDDPLFPSVENAYHKHCCVTVLVDDDDYATAARRLREWIDAIEACEPFIEKFSTGATGMQALFSGTTRTCVRIKRSAV